MRSDDDIGSNARAVAGSLHLFGDLGGEPPQRLAPADAVAADIDPQTRAVVAEAPLRRHPREVLHRLQRRAARSDQQSEVVAGDLHLEVVAVLGQRRLTLQPEGGDELLDESTGLIPDGGCAHD